MLYSGQARPYRCRFHRARGSSPRPKTVRKLTAGVTHHCNNKNSYIPIFFGPQSVSITTSIAAFGGREGNRQSAVLGNILLILLLDWISESRRSFFFSTTTHLLSSFCGSASTYSYSTDGPSSHSSRLGKWHSLDQHLISTPLFSNIRYLGRAPVWRLTSILLYLVACLLFLGRGESALFTTS